VKRVLFVTSSFAPVAVPCVYRTLKFVKYLGEHGYEPEVLWVHGNRSRPRDQSLMLDVPEGLRVHVARSILGRAMCALSAFFTGRPWIKEDHAFFAEAARLAKRRHAERPFDAFVLSAPPLRLPLLGIDLARELSIPWILDLRDPWGTFTPKLECSARVRAMIERMECDAYASAGRVVVVTRGMADQIAGRFPDARDKLALVHNGFDDDEFADARYEPTPGLLRLYFGGTLRTGPDLDAVVSGIEEALAKEPGLRDVLRIEITGRRTGDMAKRVAVAGLGSNITVSRPVSNREFARKVAGADILFFYLPWASEYAYSMKVFSYLRSGRPILAVTPPEGPAARIIGEFDAGALSAPGDAAAFAEGLLSYYRRWRDGGLATRPLDERLKRFDRENLAGMLAGELDRITA